MSLRGPHSDEALTLLLTLNALHEKSHKNKQVSYNQPPNKTI